MTVLLPLKEGIMNCSVWKLEVYSSENISSAGDCHSSLSGSLVVQRLVAGTGICPIGQLPKQ